VQNQFLPELETTLQANELDRTKQKFCLNKNDVNDKHEQQQWTPIYTHKSHIEMPVSLTVHTAVLGSYFITKP